MNWSFFVVGIAHFFSSWSGPKANSMVLRQDCSFGCYWFESAFNATSDNHTSFFVFVRSGSRRRIPSLQLQLLLAPRASSQKMSPTSIAILEAWRFPKTNRLWVEFYSPGVFHACKPLLPKHRALANSRACIYIRFFFLTATLFVDRT